MLKDNDKLHSVHLVFHEGDFYYADENEGYNIEYRYEASDGLKKQAVSNALKGRVRPLINRMNDENLPDWSALPTDTVEDGDGAQKEQLESFARDSFTRTIEDNKKKLANLHDTANPEKAIKEAQNKVNKIDEILENNVDERNYGIIELSNGQRKNYMEQRNGLLKKISKLEKVTPYDEERAQRGELLLLNNIKEKQEKLIISALSNHYPSSDPKVRKAAAVEWISKHPEAVNEESFKNLLNNATTKTIDKPLTNSMY